MKTDMINCNGTKLGAYDRMLLVHSLKLAQACEHIPKVLSYGDEGNSNLKLRYFRHHPHHCSTASLLQSKASQFLEVHLVVHTTFD